MLVPGIIFFISQNKYEVAKDKIFLPSDSSMYVAFSKGTHAKYQFSIYIPYLLSLWNVRTLVFKVF